MRKTLLLVFFIAIIAKLNAQVTEVSGKVTDANTGEALPFVNVIFSGTSIGATTDFDGFYKLSTSEKVDSVQVSYLGYKTLSKPIIRGTKQIIHFRLVEDLNELEEFVVKPGVNPALRIIKAAQENREANNYEKLKAFQYESYTKVQLAVDQLSEKTKNSRMFKSIVPLFDTVSQLNDGTNTPVLPIFISETISDFYVSRSPFKEKEIIKATKVSGVGLEDGSVTSQLLGSTFQQYNFHVNSVTILDKGFVSPIADISESFYVFTLKDSVEIDGVKTYQIELNPKRKGDLVFTGTIWISDSTFAIRRLQCHLDKGANLNFLDQFKIQQEYVKSESSAWVPVKTRILINLDEPSSTAPGMIALFYVSNKNIIVNQPKEAKFYEDKLVVQENATAMDDSFWEENRHEQQTEGDKKIAHMIDTLSNLPVVKTWVEWVNIIVSGYKRVGKVDIGPYAFLYGFNALEGHRFRIGFRTNHLLTEKFVWRGYVAYGTYDQRWKYMGEMEWFPDKKNWTAIGIRHRDDVDQIGVTDQNYDQSNLFTSLALFQASQLNRSLEQMLWIKRQHNSSWSNRLTFHTKRFTFEPIGDRFNFAFFETQDPNFNVIASNFKTTSVTLETKFAYQEQFILNHNERYSLGAKKGPAITLSYTHGFKDILGGDFEYDRLNLNLQQRIRMGPFGDGDYILSAGKVFGILPYPILDVQRGNQSFISNRSTYNLMKLFEFVSDEYVSLNYEHHFNGFLLNRIPINKRLKWRFFLTAKGIWGGISNENLALLPKVDESGRAVTQFYRLNREPYVEVGYGIENIFSFGRIDFIHRMTHLGNPNVSTFGVKLSMQFSF